MKKVFSVLLIAILLLNVLGYYGVFLGLQYQNDLAMIKVLDANRYDESQTFTVKVPMAIPYMADQSEFERVDGKFEHMGEHFRIVKQKYSNDTLTVVCLKDQATKELSQALSQYVKTFTDTPSGNNQNSKIELNFIKDYLPEQLSMFQKSAGWELEIANSNHGRHLTSTYAASVIHPPENG